MADEKKVVIKKEFVEYHDEDGRFRKKDHDRLALKSAEAVNDERDLSDFTAKAAGYVVAGYQEQYKKGKSRIGAADKKKKGIWSAVVQLRREHPDIDPDAVWNNLNSKTVDNQWDLEIRDGRLYQYDADAGKETSISFETFARHYFAKAKPK